MAKAIWSSAAGSSAGCTAQVRRPSLNGEDGCFVANTVDGRNPALVEVGSLSNYVQGFIHISGDAGFFPPTGALFLLACDA